MARAMWKGQLQLGKQELAVKLYSAVEDRTIHFHLLHAKDRAPVEQHIVRKDTGKDVDKDDMRKAFALNRGTAVILEPEELAKLVPPESRDIEICRFVAPSVLGDQWYDRPYYLGPDADDGDYFALAEALAPKERGRHRALGHAQEALCRRADFDQRLPDAFDIASRRPGAELLRHRARQGEYAAPRPS